jgi:hypothetical protein
MFQTTDSLCSDTFQPKIFRLKMSKTSETREFQTVMFETTDSLCPNTFQPKIFRLKMSKTSEFCMFQTTDN